MAEEVEKKEKENDEEKEMMRGTKGGEKNGRGRMEDIEKKEGEKSVTSLTCFTVIGFNVTGFQLRLCSLMMASLCRNTLQ